MSSLSCLFIIQGEGRGHLTQALALRAMLARAGHRVPCVVVGHASQRMLPSYFLEKINAPIVPVQSLHLVYDNHFRSIRRLATLATSIGHLRGVHKHLNTLDDLVRTCQPDVIVNFFEPLVGLYALRFRPQVPIVSVAHQYVFLHPNYRFPAGSPVQREGLKGFTRLTAAGSTCQLALSLYPLPDLPNQNLRILPPLLRDELLTQPLDQREPFHLVYLLNKGFAEDIIQWHRQHPNQVLHCFCDQDLCTSIQPVHKNLTFHPLDDGTFLSLMARCSGLVTTAGFESIAEAMYLGKPVLAVPVPGHFEQQCNALDVTTARAGLASTHFDIDRLLCHNATSSLSTNTFRQWVNQAEAPWVQAIEEAAGVYQWAMDEG